LRGGSPTLSSPGDHLRSRRHGVTSDADRSPGDGLFPPDRPNRSDEVTPVVGKAPSAFAGHFRALTFAHAADRRPWCRWIAAVIPRPPTAKQASWVALVAIVASRCRRVEGCVCFNRDRRHRDLRVRLSDRRVWRTL